MRYRMQHRMREEFDCPKTVLHACARDDDIPRLRQLLTESSDRDLERQHDTWGTALHVAVYCDNLAAAALLLRAGADPLAEMPGDIPSSSILVAIRLGGRDILQRIWNSVPPESHANGHRPYLSCLTHAAAYGQVSILEDLLDWWNGWSSEVRDCALLHAAMRWQIYTVDILLKRVVYSQGALFEALNAATTRKCELWTETTGPKYEGIDYLHQQQLISRLIDAGAAVNHVRQGRHLIIQAAGTIDLAGGLKTLLEKGADPDGTNEHGQSALHRLGTPIGGGPGHSGSIHETGIRLLLENGASVCRQDLEGNTPLHCAAFGSNLRIFQLYLSRYAQENQDNMIKTMENKQGETLLHWAAAGGKTDIMEYLISLGLDVNKPNSNHWTPLVCAVTPSKGKNGSEDAIRAAGLLLLHNADALVTTTEGWTPLHCLALHADKDRSGNMAALAEELIMRGADVEARASMLAPERATTVADRSRFRLCWGSRLQEVMQLAASNPDIIKQDLTPLQWAAHHGAAGVVKAVLAHGADPSCDDGFGNTPARLVIDSPHLRYRLEIKELLIQLLIDAGGSV